MNDSIIMRNLMTKVILEHIDRKISFYEKYISYSQNIDYDYDSTKVILDKIAIEIICELTDKQKMLIKDKKALIVLDYCFPLEILTTKLVKNILIK